MVARGWGREVRSCCLTGPGFWLCRVVRALEVGGADVHSSVTGLNATELGLHSSSAGELMSLPQLKINVKYS